MEENEFRNENIENAIRMAMLNGEDKVELRDAIKKSRIVIDIKRVDGKSVATIGKTELVLEGENIEENIMEVMAELSKYKEIFDFERVEILDDDRAEPEKKTDKTDKKKSKEKSSEEEAKQEQSETLDAPGDNEVGEEGKLIQWNIDEPIAGGTSIREMMLGAGISEANGYLRVFVDPNKEGRMLAEEKTLDDKIFGKHVGENEKGRMQKQGEVVEIDMTRIMLLLREQIKEELVSEFKEREPHGMPGQAEHEANRAAEVIVEELLKGKTHEEARKLAGVELERPKDEPEQEGPSRGNRPNRG